MILFYGPPLNVQLSAFSAADFQTKVGLNVPGVGVPRTYGYHQLPDVVLWHIKIILDSLIMYTPLYLPLCVCAPNNNPKANTSYLSLLFLYFFFFVPEPNGMKGFMRKMPPASARNSHSEKNSGSECRILWIFTTLGWVA